MTKNQKIGYSLAGLGCVAIAIAVYQYRHHRHAVPQKTLEEVMQERANHALGDLTSPLGTAVTTKNWTQLDQYLKAMPRPHMELANVIRALFIQNKLSLFNPSETDTLEVKIIDLLEKEPIKDELGYGILSNQLYRLPLLAPTSESYKKLEQMVHSKSGGAYHEQAKIVAIGKLIMQALPPPEAVVKQFESLLGKMDATQWTTFLDGVRHEPTQTRLNEYAIKNWSHLNAAAQVQALTVFSTSITVPNNREMILNSLRALKSGQNQGLMEGSLRYLSALNDKGQLSADQKSKIGTALANINKAEKSPYLTGKIDDLVKKLK